MRGGGNSPQGTLFFFLLLSLFVLVLVALVAFVVLVAPFVFAALVVCAAGANFPCSSS